MSAGAREGRRRAALRRPVPRGSSALWRIQSAQWMGVEPACVAALPLVFGPVAVHQHGQQLQSTHRDPQLSS